MSAEPSTESETGRSEISTVTSSPGDSPDLRPRAANGRFVRATGATPPAPDGLPADRFLDREISWLQFNERVLQMAADPDMPLLERARFLAIFTSNLDEFFMVRVAGLKRRIATGIAVRSASGLEPREVLEQISKVSHDLTAAHARIFEESVRPALVEEGISIITWSEVDDAEQARVSEIFTHEIFPVLTPLAVDPAHPFPYISGLSLNLAVVLINPKTGKEHFARIKVPPSLPRFLAVRPAQASVTAELFEARFLALEEVIAAHLDQLFPGMEVHEHYTFRVTRNEDLEVEEDDNENLLTALERELTRRRFGPPVRLEVEEGMDDHVMELLTRELAVHEDEVYRLPAPLDLRGLNTIADIDRSDLHFAPFVARTNAELAPTESAKPRDILAKISRQDVLLHHPYDSFSTSVQAFVEQAAADPKVLAIKQTLYRTSGDSPIVDALIDAAEAGKQVLAVVEIKARFDEQANIEWARKLEHAGVHVVYGIVGLKTHCKLSLVVRQEAEGVRRYCHIGTGNYNPKTARLYEDLGLLTADPEVGEDLTRLFNQLSGLAPRSKFKRLLVAPRSLRPGLVERIEREAERARAGEDGYVGIKVNSMVDEELIDALYRASQAGARVDVWVRGICALRPGVEGLSENIRVHSVLGRFLEHSRVFVFGTDEHREAWIGSADMMHRNLDRRVEALVRMRDPRHVDELFELMAKGMSGDYAHWSLRGDGRWTRQHRGEEELLPDVQAQLIAMYAKRRRKARR
ncbi:RNA degradosome polyphosphate kinase [Janibacter melonis]|uniref:Polyphosphate kinase n=1 Tax=Janibacter melonis TaxID=262209 RepID=A0A5P8FPY7_9MICO|nr:RNA degradosome polyphosphate kinase [Janibacter melonis]MCB5991607.1 RNA degradosome polyphosphate kinase [Janibacter melonis]QFQ31110.2 RNA degradosome polyphosphate kinase [Janibacter melonis]